MGRPAGRFLALAVLAAVALAGRAPAAPAPGVPSLEVSVPGKAVSVGDHVELRLRGAGGGGLLWGDPRIDTSGAAGQAWAVVQAPKPVEGSEPPAWTAVLAPLETGKLELPTVTVSVRKPGGAAVEVAGEGASPVEVASVLPPGEKVKPAPLADPVGVTGFPWEWVVPVGTGILVLALLAWALWRWRRRRRVGTAGEGLQPPLEELRSLVSRLAEEAGSMEAEELCDALARGLRRYLERSTGEPAGEMTSFEIQRLARRSGWPAAVQAGLRDALALADGVRFAKRPAAGAEVRDVLRRLLGAGEELEAWLRPAEEAESPQGEAA